MFYLAIVLATLILLTLGGIAYQAAGVQADRRRFPAPGKLIEVGGRRLHLFEMGSGSPAVILESGIAASSLNWRTVQAEVAKFARVCSYDRAGLGWSDLSDQPCTPSVLAEQLHVMLRAAEILPPYVLAGHSFGALIVRAFASKYPEESVGIVLVDPLDPAEWTPLTTEQQRMINHGIALSRRGALAAKLGVVRVCLKLLLAGGRFVPKLAAKIWSGKASEVTDRIAGQVRKMPPETWPWVAAHWMQPKCFEGMARHFECLAECVQEMNGAPATNLPVTLLSGKLNEHPNDPRQYAARISAETKFVIAENSGHWIQLDEPELVVSSIRELVEAARGEKQDRKSG